MRKLLCLALLTGTAWAAQPPPPPAPTTSFVFSATVTLLPTQVIGATPLGGRRIVPITGGSFAGPGNGAGIAGTVLPGGADWQLLRADGSLLITADYMIETDDHVQIRVHNAGVVVHGANGKPAYFRTSPEFEAPMGKYGWLNDAVFVGEVAGNGDKLHPAVQVTVYKVN